MARYYNTDEVLEMVLDRESQDSYSSSSSEDSGDEDTDYSVGKEQPESSSHEESSDDESEGEMETEDAASGWNSKSGKIIWSPTNSETLRYVPAPTNITPGPTHYAAARIRDPASSFSLFLTDEIVLHTVAMTNLHGGREVADWREMDCDEFRAYVGLLILAGVYRSRNESSLSLWGEKYGRDIFRATMSHKRFHQIGGALRFDDKLSRPREDKLAAFRKVWDLWTHRLELLFSPDRDICVDEQLVPYRGRCNFKQYIPGKPAKYGLKVWAVCDVKTSYAWRLQVYTGKAGDQELLRRKLALVGTTRKNKTELPPQLLQTRGRAIFSSAFTLTHTIVSYIPRRRKNVSTKHRTPDVSEGQKRKPVIIQDYNRCKGGVDNLDKVVGTYSCRRRTNRWPVALFHNLLDVSLYNSFVVWTAIDPSWKQHKRYRRRLYIEEVAEALINPHILKRGRLPRSSGAADVVMSAQSAAAGPTTAGPNTKDRRLCEFCTDKRRRTCSTCCKCEKPACKDHSLSICSLCFN
ncbi:piggyBac transposable element-derived protein 4 [Oreochromis niloticus]|uniref:piggyBac transposable element-derived protein 4 n=1 Tax=Oreochromis niloticus TaxID=8128 RepID=UPI00090573B1|nr:piggyBac transposable element-derived protein 4 [Oreochromis niloticus]